MISSLCSQAADIRILACEDVKPVVIKRLDYGELVECNKLELLKSGSTTVIENLEVGRMYLIRSGLITRYFYAIEEGLDVELYEKKIVFSAPQGINMCLDEWYNISDAVRCMSSEFYRMPHVKLDTTFFFDQYRKLHIIENQIIEKYQKSLSVDMFEVLNTIVKCDMDNFLYSFILNPGISASFSLVSDFVKDKVKKPYFNSVKFLEYYPDAVFYLIRYVKISGRCRFSFDELLKQLNTNDLKAFYACIEADRAKTHTEVNKIKERWGQYFTSPVLVDRFDRKSNKLSKLAIGEAGFDFALPDLNDKIVKFSDFKGKVVLVDLWATWCGPCRRELPHVLKLKEELKNEDIVIICISVDKQDLKEKWRNVAKSLGGIQLLDSDNIVGSYYKCGAVPHFLLFDKAGKIVSLNANFPSNPSLLRELKKLL